MDKELVTRNDPKSPITESFKTIRTNLQFINFEDNLKSILITSTMPGEGKSWVTANLAVAFSQAGRKVLIIDCDMRKGRQHKIFKAIYAPGLSNLLSSVSTKKAEKKLENFVIKTKTQNIELLPMGQIPPNPSELLNSKKMAEILAVAREKYDLVLLDGTPTLLVADSMILSRLVDTTIIVSQYGRTKKEDLAKVKKDIANVGGRLAGVVINKIPMSGKKYESGYYHASEDEVELDVPEQDAPIKYNEEKIEEIVKKLITEEKKETVVKNDETKETLSKSEQLKVTDDNE